MGTTILSPILNIVLLFMGYGSIGMVVVTTVIAIVVDLVNVVYCLISLKMEISFISPNYRLLKDIFSFSIFIAINQIIDQINWQTDQTILGKLVNGAAVVVYPVGAHIKTLYINFSTAISSVFTPKIHKIANMSGLTEEEKNEQFTDLFVKVGRIQWFLLMLIMTGFIFFGQFFILKWAGEGYENAYLVALLLMLPATITLSQNIGIEVQRAKNMHQFRSIIYLDNIK